MLIRLTVEVRTTVDFDQIQVVILIQQKIYGQQFELVQRSAILCHELLEQTFHNGSYFGVMVLLGHTRKITLIHVDQMFFRFKTTVLSLLGYVGKVA